MTYRFRFFFLLAVLWFYASAAVSGRQTPDLKQAVLHYWESLEAGDLYSALDLVASDSKNIFLRFGPVKFTDWKLLELSPGPEGAMRASIEVEQQLEAGRHSVRRTVSQTWIREEGAWKLKLVLPDMTGSIRQAFGREGKEEQLAPELIVTPARVRLSFLNPRQIGWLTIKNGLDHPVRLKQIELDKERFQVLQMREEVAGRSEARIGVEYVGEEEEKELTSRLTLVLDSDGDNVRIEREIVYNHISAAARAMLGLSEEEAAKLKRGQKVSPAVSLPQEKKKPPKKKKPPQSAIRN